MDNLKRLQEGKPLLSVCNGPGHSDGIFDGVEVRATSGWPYSAWPYFLCSALSLSLLSLSLSLPLPSLWVGLVVADRAPLMCGRLLRLRGSESIVRGRWLSNCPMRVG